MTSKGWYCDIKWLQRILYLVTGCIVTVGYNEQRNFALGIEMVIQKKEDIFFVAFDFSWHTRFPNPLFNFSHIVHVAIINRIAGLIRCDHNESWHLYLVHDFVLFLIKNTRIR